MQATPAQNETICNVQPSILPAKQERGGHVNQPLSGAILRQMTGLARLLVVLGLLLLIAGGVVYVLGLLGVSFGHLPGDFAWRRRNVAVYFPLGTCIAISVVLTLVLYVITRLRR